MKTWNWSAKKIENTWSRMEKMAASLRQFVGGLFPFR